MNSLPSGTGFSSSPGSPFYVEMGSKDNLTQKTTSQLIQGSASTSNPGVVLTKDSLIPIEVQFGITDERTNPSKPTLMPLFRTRYVEDHPADDGSQSIYQNLRSGLSADLQKKLEVNDEAIRNGQYELVDPDVVALDMSLRFQATVMALTAGLSTTDIGSEAVLVGTQQFSDMPEMVMDGMTNYGTILSDVLDTHLSDIGSNNPSYDILLSASNQMKSALALLE